ncbi:MAG TPA: hypothetical protein VKT77_02130, partial [Chthonomonadaceae bacterium]|nr:hypothetical protein [Chthonomonadaceae bacterium]
MPLDRPRGRPTGPGRAPATSSIGALTIGGAPAAPLFVNVAADTEPADVAAAAGAGIRLFRLAGLDLGWRGPDQFDYAALDAV